MSDFLVSLVKQYTGKDLLNLVKKPYGKRVPEGRCFDMAWGSIAVLQERLAQNNNILEGDGSIFAWVGDLAVEALDKFAGSFADRLTYLQQHAETKSISLRNDELFQKLNGTFAIISANAGGFSIVTDPFGVVPVYIGKNKRGDIVSLGTHPDLVAVTSDAVTTVDKISAAEFVNTGRSTFPNTMYTNVKELKPGSVHCASFKKNSNILLQTFRYWSPPQELDWKVDERELAEELANAVTLAVASRCHGKVGISLSGGLDSRLILAAVPGSVECIALTFGDAMNREMKTAQRVAKAYNRPWFPLFREKEYIGNNFLHGVKLVGCENNWLCPKGLGFVEEIEKFGLDTLLNGDGVDCFTRGCDAKDVVPVKRWAGILPDNYVKVKFDYENVFSAFWKSNIKEQAIEQARARRRAFYNDYLDANRTSMAQLLLMYPHSQSDAATSRTAERRVMPTKFCGFDRRILDFGFRCPVTLQLDNQIRFSACKEIYGKGYSIPNANDGVRPGSGHWSRLVQRAVRKFQDRTTSILEKLGKEPKIQHSWHDYQKYWRESKKLEEMRHEYGTNLDQFDGVLFKESSQELLYDKDIDWHYGFRLLHLAVWLAIIEEYRDVLKVRAR